MPMFLMRELPQAKEARVERETNLWNEIEKAECAGRFEDLLQQHTVSWASAQLDAPVTESLWADPPAAERLREHIKKTWPGKVVRWDAELKAIRVHKRKTLTAEIKRSRDAQAPNPEPVDFEDTE